MIISFHDWVDDPATTTFNTGDKLAGKVTFLARETRVWPELRLEEVFDLSGSLRATTQDLHTHILDRNVSIKAGEQKTYDFVIPLGRVVTYQGKNGSARAGLKAVAHPAREDVGLLSSLFGKKGVVDHTQPIVVTDGPEYRIAEHPLSLTANRNNTTMGAFFIACLVCTGLTVFLKLPWVFAAVLWIGYFATFAFRSYIISQLGTLTVTPSAAAGGEWSAKVEFQETGAHIRRLSAWYDVVEEVTDNRGTSTSEYKENLHAGRMQHRRGDGTVYRFEHQFPPDLPPSRNYGDLEINWKYNVKVEAASGLTFIFEAPLSVTRHAETTLPDLPEKPAAQPEPKERGFRNDSYNYL